MKRSAWFGLFGAIVLSAAQAVSLEVPVSLVSIDGAQKDIGTIKIDETAYGLIFTPNLNSLPPVYMVSIFTKTVFVREV